MGTVIVQITDEPKNKSELETQTESSNSPVAKRKLANTIKVSGLQVQDQSSSHRPKRIKVGSEISGVDVNSPSHDGQHLCIYCWLLMIPATLFC